MDNVEKRRYLLELKEHYTKFPIDDDILFTVLNIDFELIYSSKAFCQLLGMPDNYNYFGKRMEEVNARMSQIIGGLNKIFTQIIETRTQLDYFIIFDFIESKPELLSVTGKPIYYPNQEILGIKIIRYKTTLLNHRKLLDQVFYTSKSTPSRAPASIFDKFTDRETNILFLLVTGYTQTEIGEILNLPRGTVGRIINTSLVEKLGVLGTSSKVLVEKAISLGFGSHIPKSLYKPQVIVIPKDTAEQ
ncbi:MAG: helix-turn-helix transcriptional regulator [Burkholderiales bacterium]